MDAIHFKVRRDTTIVSKAAYAVIGVNLEGKKMYSGYGLDQLNHQNIGY